MNVKPLLIAVVCATCACASAPQINYFSLGIEPTGEVRTPVNVTVERFSTTEALGRSQIMIRASATRIEYYAVDQWAGGIGELVQQKLAAEFGAPVAGRKGFTVSGKVVACEQVDRPGGSEASVKLDVLVREEGQARYHPPFLERTYEARREVGGRGAGPLVEALSACVEEIAAAIGADLATQESAPPR